MLKYFGIIVESGIFENIDKFDYMRAFDELDVVNRKIEKGGVLFVEGDIVDKICIVAKGSIRGEKNYPDGEVHIMDIYEEASVFASETAVSKLKTTPLDYIGNEDSDVLFIDIEKVKRSSYGYEIIDALMQKLADDNIKKEHKIEILAKRGLRDRIMVYLDVLMRKAGSSTVTVKMNREQMAQYLCVNRSALSNELNKMRRDGIIDFQRNQFKIL